MIVAQKATYVYNVNTRQSKLVKIFVNDGFKYMHKDNASYFSALITVNR